MLLHKNNHRRLLPIFLLNHHRLFIHIRPVLLLLLLLVSLLQL